MDIAKTHLVMASQVVESLPKRISYPGFSQMWWELTIYLDEKTKDLAIAYIGKTPGKPTHLDTSNTLFTTFLDKTHDINVHYCKLGTSFQEMRAPTFVDCITLFSRRVHQAKELNQITVLL